MKKSSSKTAKIRETINNAIAAINTQRNYMAIATEKANDPALRKEALSLARSSGKALDLIERQTQDAIATIDAMLKR